MRICVENSTWNNIGDAFYQTALERFIRECLPEADVVPTDGPVRRAFPIAGKCSNAMDSRLYHEGDVWVFSGPILFAWFNEYADFVEKLVRSGKRYMLVSVSAGREQTPQEIDRLRDFFNRFPPLLIATRDTKTFSYLQGVNCAIENSVCAAWFAPQYLPHSKLEIEGEYFCSSFYSTPEPHLACDSHLTDIASLKCVESKSRVPHRIKRILDTYGPSVSSVGGRRVVRPQHATASRVLRLLFPAPNSLVSYNPSSYLAAYSGCLFTITDRVHAAVVTLAMGKPVRLFYSGLRCTLFDAMGVAFERGAVMQPPPRGEISRRQDELRLLLQSAVQAIR